MRYHPIKTINPSPKIRVPNEKDLSPNIVTP